MSWTPGTRRAPTRAQGSAKPQQAFAKRRALLTSGGGRSFDPARHLVNGLLTFSAAGRAHHRPLRSRAAAVAHAGGCLSSVFLLRDLRRNTVESEFMVSPGGCAARRESSSDLPAPASEKCLFFVLVMMTIAFRNVTDDADRSFGITTACPDSTDDDDRLFLTTIASLT